MNTTRFLRDVTEINLRTRGHLPPGDKVAEVIVSWVEDFRGRRYGYHITALTTVIGPMPLVVFAAA